MTYYQAIIALKAGATVKSPSGQVITPEMAGFIWVGEYYSSTDYVGLTRVDYLEKTWTIVERDQE